MTTDTDQAPALDLLLECVGDELAAALERRGRRQRSFSAAERRALQRALAGGNVSLAVLVRLADALQCRVRVALVDVAGDTDVATEVRGVRLDP